MDYIRSPLIFGEVLFDCFPDGRETLGGAPFNVAWNLTAFSMEPVFVSRIGNDDLGQRIVSEMNFWNMDSRYLQIDPEKPTGRVQIQLNEGEPLFSILPDQAYDHIGLPAKKLNTPAFLYHGSLALRNDVSRGSLMHLKREHQCPVFIDVNLRPPWWKLELVHDFLPGATWLKLNEDELDQLFPGSASIEDRCRSLIETFKLQAVFVTLGKKGALAYSSDNSILRVAPQENIAVKDTVGAGDAFSSILLLGLMSGWSLNVTLKRAQEFASAVVGQRGAITKDKEFYLTFKNKWKKDDIS